MSLFTHNLGFPRIGAHRELKKATEGYWKGTITAPQLQTVAAEIRRTNWLQQKQAGINLIPSNDFSLYDQVLDATCLVGNVPRRFGAWQGEVSLDQMFALARGVRQTGETSTHDCCRDHSPGFAGEMTKWFDTNYHYIVPELSSHTHFQLGSNKPFAEYQEALAFGIRTKPVLLGPLTYLWLGKTTEAGFDRFFLLDNLVDVYGEILQKLEHQGVEWVQLDEPALALDLNERQRRLYQQTYEKLRQKAPSLKFILASYFGEFQDNLPVALQLPVQVLHIDAVRGGSAELGRILEALPDEKSLSLGIVDGRNIWKNDFERSLAIIRQAVKALGYRRVLLAPSCSLLHVPRSLKLESKLDNDLKNWLAFAEEKLTEVTSLAVLAIGGEGNPLALHENQKAILSRRASQKIHRPEVTARLAQVQTRDFQRGSPFAQRQVLQSRSLGLPLFPTTTIGSFPQTQEVRAARARFKRGEWSREAYQGFLREETARAIRFQDEIGLDVPVHGEFERNDMVEYFGEQLAGFAFTENGWVQSYGSRCVKPPIIYGDVCRPHPMTVEWSTYAQSLTSRPMKGMLTGPITILQWSFVRDDQPRKRTAWQIALALRDEVQDLERAGIRIIQIDEPALREGLPLRKADWEEYLGWAVNAFQLSAAGVQDTTQIHTHMCYAEFNDIIQAIADLDADVISIETSRSNMELLGAFVDFRYPNEIGPGVYDIHSPRVPTIQEMTQLMQKAARVLPVKNLWINPDCGLKTRGWPEVRTALRNMVAVARELRASF